MVHRQTISSSWEINVDWYSHTLLARLILVSRASCSACPCLCFGLSLLWYLSKTKYWRYLSGHIIPKRTLVRTSHRYRYRWIRASIIIYIILNKSEYRDDYRMVITYYRMVITYINPSTGMTIDTSWFCLCGSYVEVRIRDCVRAVTGECLSKKDTSLPWVSIWTKVRQLWRMDQFLPCTFA